MKQKTLKNSLKNAALVVLVLLLGALTLLAWDAGLLTGGVQGGLTPLARLQTLLPTGDGGYAQRAGETPAAYPVRLAVSSAGGLVGASYQEAYATPLYDTARPFFASALADAGSFGAAEESALTSALSGSVISAEYAGRVPLTLLGGWFGGKASAQADGLSVGSLVLTRDGALFVRDSEDGALYRAETRVDTSAWDRAFEGLSAAPCDFAAALGGAYARLYPETIVPREAQAFDICTARAPAYWEAGAAESLQQLLTAFGYDPSLQSYAEGDGDTQVFVDTESSLRVGRDGAVRYESASGGLSAYAAGAVEGADALAARVDFAQKLLTGALASLQATASPMLEGAATDAESGVCTLKFTQLVAGVPVRTPAEEPFAVLTFRDGLLVSAELHLRVYEPTGERLYALPPAQAAAASPKAPCGYAVAYREDEDARLLPTAFLK